MDAARRPAPPETYHARNHEGEFEACPRCARALAKCQSKLRFASPQEADEWVREFNETYGYDRPVQRYPCRWCPGWHMKTAKRKVDRQRAEKQRRRWLARQATDHFT